MMSEPHAEPTPRIRCADCAHCLQYRQVDESTGRYVLKVKCRKGHWKRGRKHGAVDLHRVLARRMQKCMDYNSMSEDDQDREQYLRDLAATLPLERIIYDPTANQSTSSKYIPSTPAEDRR